MRLFVNKYPHAIIERVGCENYQQHYGFLTIPNSMSPFYAYMLGVPWGMDNFAFSNFNPKAFVDTLRRYQKIPGCRFAAVPDVVADAKATMRRFAQWADQVRYFGYPVGLVAQDGLENMKIPWDDFDALFIGGSTDWKLGKAARGIIAEATVRNKWVHMGRVNTARRIRYAQSVACDSIDGSSYATHLHKVVTHTPYLDILQLPLFKEAI